MVYGGLCMVEEKKIRIGHIRHIGPICLIVKTVRQDTKIILNHEVHERREKNLDRMRRGINWKLWTRWTRGRDQDSRG